MAMDAAKGNDVTSDSRKQFDEILERHIQRLVGAPDRIGELPLNLVNISCSILFAEQATNEMEGFATSADRFTEESILAELAGIGLGATPGLASAIQEMVQAGYISMDAEGGLAADKHILSMTQLLDRIFPKMPGMNLVAYLLQTVDEVESGRKHSAAALRQFDETLELHGVNFLDDGIRAEENTTSGEMGEERDPNTQEPPPDPGHRQVPAKNRPILPDRYRFVKQNRILKKQDGPPAKSKIFSANNGSSQAEIREVTFGGPLSGQNPPDTRSPGSRESSVPEEPEAVSLEEIEAEDSKPVEIEETSSVSEGPDALVDDETATGAATIEAAAGAHLPESILESPPSQDDAVVSQEVPHGAPREEPLEPANSETPSALTAIESAWGSDPETIDDDAIERNIAEFEDRLAMQCPLCKNSGIQTEGTATGKAYYRCLDKHCGFISWGRPHHIVCPNCQNPFLIEDLKPNGVAILKCPRATCRYWQRASDEGMEKVHAEETAVPGDTEKTLSKPKKPRRRVVRKRVVRRKR